MIDDKNPKDCFGDTPFHYAATQGHLQFCELVIQWIDEKNPKNNEENSVSLTLCYCHLRMSPKEIPINVGSDVGHSWKQQFYLA